MRYTEHHRFVYRGHIIRVSHSTEGYWDIEYDMAHINYNPTMTARTKREAVAMAMKDVDQHITEVLNVVTSLESALALLKSSFSEGCSTEEVTESVDQLYSCWSIFLHT